MKLNKNKDKKGKKNNKTKRVTEGSYVVLCVFLLRWVLILPTVPPVRKFMPVGTPAEFKVTHMNNWLQGLGHSLQFLFQDKFIIIRSHLALNIAGLGTSRSNGYLIFLLQEEQATGNLKWWFNNNNGEKKSHCHSFVGVGFYQSGELWTACSTRVRVPGEGDELRKALRFTNVKVVLFMA